MSTAEPSASTHSVPRAVSLTPPPGAPRRMPPHAFAPRADALVPTAPLPPKCVLKYRGMKSASEHLIFAYGDTNFLVPYTSALDTYEFFRQLMYSREYLGQMGVSPPLRIFVEYHMGWLPVLLLNQQHWQIFLEQEIFFHINRIFTHVCLLSNMDSETISLHFYDQNLQMVFDTQIRLPPKSTWLVFKQTYYAALQHSFHINQVKFIYIKPDNTAVWISDAEGWDGFLQAETPSPAAETTIPSNSTNTPVRLSWQGKLSDPAFAVPGAPEVPTDPTLRARPSSAPEYYNYKD